MRQLLLLILFVLAARWLVRLQRGGQPRTKGRAGTDRAASSARGTRAGNTPSLAEPVVRCAACGVHAPRSESVLVDEQYFCCAEHARPYAARAAGTR